MFKHYPEIFGVSTLCQALNIGRNKAYELLKNNEIQSIRIGRVHKIPKTYVIDYINNAIKQSNRLLVTGKGVI